MYGIGEIENKPINSMIQSVCVCVYMFAYELKQLSKQRTNWTIHKKTSTSSCVIAVKKTNYKDPISNVSFRYFPYMCSAHINIAGFYT